MEHVRTLFGPGEQISSEDIPAGASLLFHRWMFNMIKNNHIEPVIRGLIRMKLAKNYKDGITYLAGISEISQMHNHIVGLDFNGGHNLQALNKLKDELYDITDASEKNHVADTLFRIHGIIGHVAVPDIMQFRKNNLSFSGSEQEEMLLKGKCENNQISLFGSNAAKHPIYTQIFGQPKITKKIVGDLDILWHQIVRAVEKENNGKHWFDNYQTIKSYQHSLQDILSNVFGEETVRQVIKANGDPFSHYLVQLTLLSWATAVIYAFKSGPRSLFREIPVMAHRYGLNGGRVDALEVQSLNGRELNATERGTLDEIINRSKAGNQSAGEIAFNLEKLFSRKTLGFRILDWKFAVGDNPEPSKIIDVSDVGDNPMVKHANQMKRYLTLAFVDYHLARFGLNKPIKWKKDRYFNSGDLIYFLPFHKPVIYTVTLTPEEKERFFVENVVHKWHRANGRAQIRVLNNFLVGHVVSGLKNNGNGNVTGKHVNEGNASIIADNQAVLFSGNPRIPIEGLVHQYRQFADKFKMFEIVGVSNDGNTEFLFHLDALKKAIEDGLPTAGFSWERGGKILCPIHDDHNPSNLHVSIERRSVKCFACGAYARFSNESLINTIPQTMLENRRIIKPNQTIQDLVIPKRHAEVMGIAGVILNSLFKGGIGEKYISEERCIDPELAHSYGIGFCDDEKFIGEILGYGISFGELVSYGFIGFSDRISRERSLMPILDRCDIKPEEIQNSAPGGKARIWPYSILGGRITFPLSINNQTVNFYGRDVLNRGKRFAHRKLMVSKAGVPHGIFNEEPLSSDVEEIKLVEGPIDALTLIQMGHRGTSGIVGVKNFVILELVARTGKRIAIALDNDQGGRDATYGFTREYKGNNGSVRPLKISGLFEWFEKRGLRDKVRDFTDEFVREHGGDGWDDWNGWWKNKNKAHGS